MRKYIIQRGLVQDTVTTTLDGVVIDGSEKLGIPLKEDFNKWRLNNPDAEIIQVDPYMKPYTQEDKLHYLQENHPNVNKLIEAFDLEIP